MTDLDADVATVRAALDAGQFFENRMARDLDYHTRENRAPANHNALLAGTAALEHLSTALQAAQQEREQERERADEKNPWEWTDPGSPLQERAARLKAMSGNRDALITQLERVYVAEGLWFAHEALAAEQRILTLEGALRELLTALNGMDISSDVGLLPAFNQVVDEASAALEANHDG
ncbi:MAG TPA: hypothetical protein VJB57_11690 [Dehalococcoidia bacterium]|nr:hypothetical protein [Dehalococcoidia bacterium]